MLSNAQSFSFLHPRQTAPITQTINSLAHSSEAHGAEASTPIGESQNAKQAVVPNIENAASTSANIAMNNLQIKKIFKKLHQLD